MKDRKGNKILRFCNDIQDGKHLDGFVLFNDNWISEDIKNYITKMVFFLMF